MQACAEEAIGQLPTQMAKRVIVRILPFCGNTPPLSLVEATLVPQLVACSMALLSPPC